MELTTAEMMLSVFMDTSVSSLMVFGWEEIASVIDASSLDFSLLMG